MRLLPEVEELGLTNNRPPTAPLDNRWTAFSVVLFSNHPQIDMMTLPNDTTVVTTYPLVNIQKTMENHHF